MIKKGVLFRFSKIQVFFLAGTVFKGSVDYNDGDKYPFQLEIEKIVQVCLPFLNFQHFSMFFCTEWKGKRSCYMVYFERCTNCMGC